MGCIEAVLPEELLRRSDVNCVVSNGYGETYKDYLCLFRAIAVHLYGSSELETNAKNLFSAFPHEFGHDAINFRGVSIDHLVFVENAIKHNIFIYDIDIVDGEFVGELARRSVEMYEKNITLLRYNNHICYVDDINTFCKRFRCPSCDTFIQKAGKFNRHVKTCKDRVQSVYTFTQRACIHCARPYLINLPDLEFLTAMIKNCSKTWLFLTLNRYVYPPSN